MKYNPIWELPTDGEVDAPIALTFDDGPDPSATGDVLDTLARAGATATFFMVGAHAATHPDLVRRAVGEGHGIGVHSWAHDDLAGQPAAVTDEDIARTLEVLRSLGADPQLFRAPYDSWDDDLVEAARRAGLASVSASVGAEDWTSPGVDVIAARVAEGLYPGAIVGLHDGGGDRSQTAAAVSHIVADAHSRRFTFVDLLTQLTT
ncbi:MAG: polysaccharide deacetylase family protein [Catenulispora sp.]